MATSGDSDMRLARLVLERLVEGQRETADGRYLLSRGDEAEWARFGGYRELDRGMAILLRRGLAEREAEDYFVATDRGEEIGADERLLDAEFPEPAPAAPTVAAESDPMAAVHGINAKARKLLEYLHSAFTQNGFRHNFSISPARENLRQIGFSAADWAAAAQRLLDRGELTKMMGTGWAIGSTPAGVALHEDAEQLDSVLPITSRARSAAGAPELPADVSAGLSDIRQRAPAIVEDPALRAIVQRDAAELEGALGQGLHKAAVLLAGSIVEALLLDVCGINATLSQTYMAPRRSFPEDASLDKLLEIATAHDLLGEFAQRLADLARIHRDLIHPDNERRNKPHVDATTGAAMVSLIRLVVRDVEAARADGRIDAFRNA